LAVGTRDQAQRFIEEVQRLHKERNSNGKSKLDSMINAKLSGNGIMESGPEEVNSSEGSTNSPEKSKQTAVK
jgi:hypothetical protein